MKSFLVDVRTHEEFMEGSAKNAVNMPLDQIEDRINELKDRSQIIVFCRSGARAEKARQILNKNGIESVENGGAWQEVDKKINQ